MKKIDPYPPLALLNEITDLIPNCWDQMEQLHNENGMYGLPKWADWCYVPMSGALAAAYDGTTFSAETEKAMLAAIPRAQAVAALAPWRINKDVFILDKDIENVLCAQASDMDIPSEALLKLPYLCFYLQFDHLELEGHKVHGVFVHLEDDVNNGDKELRLLFLRYDGFYYGYPIHIGSKTIFESVELTAKQATQNVSGSQNSPTLRRMMVTTIGDVNIFINFLSKVMQCVLYVCAENAEITPSLEQATVMKKSDRIRDRYSEIRKWDVGVRIGASIRAHNAAIAHDTNATDRTHASPRPHVRRGHWHHYWTGTKDKPSERRLVLKWTPPAFVGAKQDDSPIVIHHIKGDGNMPDEE